jgi:hypothetical protein
MLESLTGIARAGAGIILTYFATRRPGREGAVVTSRIDRSSVR